MTTTPSDAHRRTLLPLGLRPRVGAGAGAGAGVGGGAGRATAGAQLRPSVGLGLDLEPDGTAWSRSTSVSSFSSQLSAFPLPPPILLPSPRPLRVPALDPGSDPPCDARGRPRHSAGSPPPSHPPSLPLPPLPPLTGTTPLRPKPSSLRIRFSPVSHRDFDPAQPPLIPLPPLPIQLPSVPGWTPPTSPTTAASSSRPSLLPTSSYDSTTHQISSTSPSRYQRSILPPVQIDVAAGHEVASPLSSPESLSPVEFDTLLAGALPKRRLSRRFSSLPSQQGTGTSLSSPTLTVPFNSDDQGSDTSLESDIDLEASLEALAWKIGVRRDLLPESPTLDAIPLSTSVSAPDLGAHAREPSPPLATLARSETSSQHGVPIPRRIPELRRRPSNFRQSYKLTRKPQDQLERSGEISSEEEEEFDLALDSYSNVSNDTSASSAPSPASLSPFTQNSHRSTSSASSSRFASSTARRASRDDSLSSTSGRSPVVTSDEERPPPLGGSLRTPKSLGGGNSGAGLPRPLARVPSLTFPPARRPTQLQPTRSLISQRKPPPATVVRSSSTSGAGRQSTTIPTHSAIPPPPTRSSPPSRSVSPAAARPQSRIATATPRRASLASTSSSRPSSRASGDGDNPPIPPPPPPPPVPTYRARTPPARRTPTTPTTSLPLPLPRLLNKDLPQTPKPTSTLPYLRPPGATLELSLKSRLPPRSSSRIPSGAGAS